VSNVVVVGSLVATLFASPGSSPVEAAAEAAAPPTRITVDVLTVNGSGCPAGTAAVSAASDNSTFTVMYSDYLAQVGVGASPTDFRKNCQLGLRVNVPSGFTYAIAKAEYSGFAHLARGATGLQQANYYFQADSTNHFARHTFAGPYSDFWQTTDQTDVASLVYAPCGQSRILNVNTELRVRAGTSDPATTTSFLTMDSTHGSVRTIFHFAWKEC
jgi:hypothetical protein